MSISVSSRWRTPKFDSAEPNSTGVSSPVAKRCGSHAAPAASSSSSSSTAVVHDSPSSLRARSGATFCSGAIVAPRAVRVKRTKPPPSRSSTPRKSPGIPTGQVSGTAAILSVDSTWSMSSSGSMPGRSYLLTNVMSGIPRARAT